MENNLDKLVIGASAAGTSEPTNNKNDDMLTVNRERIVDKLERAYGTGKKKTAIARVWLKKGTGKFLINNKDNYLAKDIVIVSILNRAFTVTNSLGQFDVFCTVKGGGTMSQLHAIRHAISVALARFSPSSYYKDLKKDGLMTRDSRIVERKKYGRKKARKKFQFSKR